MSDDPLFIVNLSVWSSIEGAVRLYRSDHKAVFKRRHEWFKRAGQAEHRAVVAARRHGTDGRGSAGAAGIT